MEERFKLFTLLITDLFKGIKRLRTEEMSKIGLKSIHLSCLYYIYREGPISSKELCEVCREDKGNISRSLKALLERGYVKELDAVRGKYVLTESGTSITELLESKINSVLKMAGEGLNDEQREIMYSGLTIISNNLAKICDNYTEIEI